MRELKNTPTKTLIKLLSRHVDREKVECMNREVIIKKLEKIK